MIQDAKASLCLVLQILNNIQYKNLKKLVNNSHYLLDQVYLLNKKYKINII